MRLEVDNHNENINRVLLAHHQRCVAGAMVSINRQGYLLRHIINLQTNSNIKHRGINGAYGLGLFEDHHHECVAVCGYDLFETRDSNLSMQINHTPQGSSDLKGKVKRSFLHNMRDFRQIMFEQMVQTADELEVKQIEVISAHNHFKVALGEIALERGLKIIDNIALENDFEYRANGNLFLDIN